MYFIKNLLIINYKFIIKFILDIIYQCFNQQREYYF